VAGLTAVALLERARRGGDVLVRYAGHAVFGGLAGALTVRWIGLDPETTPVVGPASLAELAVLGLAAIAGQRRGRTGARHLYRGAVLAGWLGWSAHELLPLANGQAYVSLVWGITTAALLAGGTWYRQEEVRRAGLGTLALFVGKLFLIDLTVLPALWRVVLFLGAGGAFLLLSYALPGLGASADVAEN
jgi:uncharacterized membrane protein